MQLTTNSVLVWKRRADESEQSARTLTRISIVLMIMMFVTGAYAYSTRARVSEICSTLQARFNATESAAARKIVSETLQAYCG